MALIGRQCSIFNVEYSSNFVQLDDQTKVYENSKWVHPPVEDNLSNLRDKYPSNHWSDLGQTKARIMKT